MRFKVLVVKSLLVALPLALIPALANSATKITPGTKCKVFNQKVPYQDKTYTCKNTGNKLIWNKGIAVAAPTPAPAEVIQAENFRFESLCEKDPFVPMEWAAYQDFALRRDIFSCARPYRFKMVSQPKAQPLQALTPKSSLNNIESCKLTHGKRDGGQIAFSSWINPKIVMNERLNVQVIPIEFTDFPSSNTVVADHEKYFKYIKNGYYNISDGQVNVNFKIPSNYFKINKKISSYDTGKRFDHGGGIWNWASMDMNAMFEDIVSTVDPDIDFSNLDLVFFVVPPTTHNDYVSHGFPAPYPQLRTAEGFIPYWYFSPPMAEVNRKSWYGVEPFLHLHELMHGMNKLDDHYGDGNFGRIDGDAGTGNWSTMSGMLTDFLFWDKWISYMVSDSQVICAKTESTSTHWIKPSNYFGKEEKMLVIPVDSTKVLVVESMRAAGFNLKLPKISEGALVYLVDITKTGHGRGINVLRPANRTGSIYERKDFALSDAPLKMGESITSNGFKITVVESGNFGDVAKVEKVG
jgi:hypothetical protein